MPRTTFTADVTEPQAALLRRVLALAQELEQLALDAPDGAVFDACEAAVLTGGRQRQQQILRDAVARRIEAAEKRGRRCAPAPAGAPRRTAAPKPGRC